MKQINTHNRPSRQLTSALRLVLLLFCIILILLCIRRIYFTDYTPAAVSETTDSLSNPYTGFYTMTGIVLSDTDTPSIPEQLKSVNTSTELVMLEINLRQYRDHDLSTAALQHLDDYLSGWKASGHQLIIRFLYDWDGSNLTSEPDNISQILTHIRQTAPVINQYKDIIYTLQGIFVGNCGEMNHSKYLDSQSISTLMNELAADTDPSIFLSVRTPLQRRMILNSAGLPSSSDAFDGSLSSRLGLFNDGMLGSANDTGTYGDGSHNTSETLAAWSRADEIAYQNGLCNYVPNGGEVVIDNPFNDLDTAISDLASMHVSYLNKDHDLSVLDKWKQTVYTGTDSPYTGLSGYDYISRHLGYRYVLTSSSCSGTSPVAKTASLSFGIKNTGFASCYRSFDLSVSITDSDGKLLDTIPVKTDSRYFYAGKTTKINVSVPVSEYGTGTFQIYLKLTDPVLEREILLASDLTHQDAYGYLLGSLKVSHLPEHSK